MTRSHDKPAMLAAALLLLGASGVAAAQESGDASAHHPFLSDRFNFGIGVFYPQKSFEIRVDGTTSRGSIDLDESFRFDDSETTGSFDFRWRFGEKWSAWAQYWKVNSQGSATLEEDIEWRDLVFKSGIFAAAGMDISVARAMVGREIFTRPGHEFGLGVGAHWLEIGAFIEGEVRVNENSTGIRRSSASADVPLPNISAWYMYSWSPKWLFLTHADWLSASVGDYSGDLWNGHVGVHYQAFSRVGIGLSYNLFIVDVDVDKSDWHGRMKTRQNGPRLVLTANW